LQPAAGFQLELVIVCNACTDNSVQAIDGIKMDLPFPVRVFEEAIPGLSIARNRCLQESKGEILAFLDDDVLVAPEWLQGLATTYSKTPAALLAGRTNLWWEAGAAPAWSSEAVEVLLSKLDYGNEIRELTRARIVGANFSFKREVSDRVGEFVTHLGRAGQGLLSGEDTEFVGRALEQGFRLFYAPAMSVRHWIPAHRTSKEYLRGLAEYRGRSQVLIALRQKNFAFLPFLRGAIARLVRGKAAQLFYAIAGREKDSLQGSLMHKRGKGILVASLQHFKSNS
jgi:glycosyltransferase involved in cell wall biosynthesis